jgi:acyl-CoA synthetase (NDP forming)
MPEAAMTDDLTVTITMRLREGGPLLDTVGEAALKAAFSMGMRMIAPNLPGVKGAKVDIALQREQSP